MKTEETKRLERSIWMATNKQGVFGCFEVTIGWYGKERVDYMTYDTKGVFRCYEIKVTKADFHSPCANSFVGHFNYYVMPKVLYEEVKEEVPAYIGVYVDNGSYVASAKQARRCQVEDVDRLKDSMIRSLSREVKKQLRSRDPMAIERVEREAGQYKRQMESYREKYWNLQREVEERYGVRWNKDDGGVK